MSEKLAFSDLQVQQLLLDFTREILISDLIVGVNGYVDNRGRLVADCPITPGLIHSALGAEALFAAWRQPVNSPYDNILHIVKVNLNGATIPGSETMVGTIYKDNVVARGGNFTDAGVREVERFARLQEELPWQPDMSTSLYKLAA